MCPLAAASLARISLTPGAAGPGLEAEPSLEASWQPGGAQGHYEAQAEQDAEPEMEL